MVGRTKFRRDGKKTEFTNSFKGQDIVESHNRQHTNWKNKNKKRLKFLYTVYMSEMVICLIPENKYEQQ